MKKLLLASLLTLLLIPSYSFANGWGRGGYGGHGGYYGGRGGYWGGGGYYGGYRGYWGGAVAAGVLGGFATGVAVGAYAPGPGYPWGYPYYPYATPYYQPAPVVVQQPAPVVVQQPGPVYQQAQPQYWYWCDNPQGYYPYVQNCPSNWKQVVPQIAPPNR